MTDLQIRYFLQVADSLSFSKAAQELFVSQPSVSRQIQRLEEELGYTLFDRSCKNTVTLTAAGLVFRDSFHKLRREFLETRAAAESLRDAPALELRAGLGAGWNLLELLEGFQRRAEQAHPRAALSFCSDSFRALRSKVHDGELDVALCTQTGVQDFQGIELEPVGELEARLFFRQDICPKPTLHALDGQVLCLLPEEEAPMSAQIILLHLQHRRIVPRIVRLPNRDSIWLALALGKGFTVWDERMAVPEGAGIVSIPLGDTIPLCTIWRKSNQNPLIRLFTETARAYFHPQNNKDQPF